MYYCTEKGLTLAPHHSPVPLLGGRYYYSVLVFLYRMFGAYISTCSGTFTYGHIIQLNTVPTSHPFGWLLLEKKRKAPVLMRMWTNWNLCAALFVEM